ncbi:MAG TPA: hypothetical protein ENH12_00580, partial [Proteobacteria bacterium]|nr:hypothetical protein [Pseudomonadota bacterium]
MNKIIIILLALLLWLSPEKLSAIIVWQSMGPSGGGSMETARFHPTDPDTIFVGGDVSGIHKTTDGGATWTMANRGLATTDGTANAYGILSIAISESNPEIMFIGTWRGVYKSADGGENWSLRRPSSPSAPELPIGAVAIDPDDPQRIFAGEGDYLGTDPGTGRFNRSTDGGDTWTVISGTGIDSQAKFSSILIDPTSPAANRAIFAATDKGVYKSADNGSTWSSATAGLPHGDSWTMTLQRTGSNVTLYLSLKIHGTAGAPATYSGGIFKSVDRGNSWQDVTGNLPRYDDWGGGEFYWYDWYHLTTHPGNPDIAYVGTYNDNGHDYNGIWKTTDGGSSWAWTTQTNPSNVQSGWIDFWDEGAGFLALSPSQPDVMVYGASELYKTTDAGSSWQQFYCDSAGGDYWRGRGLEVTYVYTLAFDPQTAGRWYVGYEDILFIKTNDDGH